MTTSFDISMFKLAVQTAASSGDTSSKVGCVLVGWQDEVLARASNDIPLNVGDKRERRERPEKYLWTEHAERAAIYSAARAGVALDGATAYVSWYPCMDCARAFASVGVRRIVCQANNMDHPRYAEEFKRTAILLDEANIEVVLVGDAGEAA